MLEHRSSKLRGSRRAPSSFDTQTRHVGKHQQCLRHPTEPPPVKPQNKPLPTPQSTTPLNKKLPSPLRHDLHVDITQGMQRPLQPAAYMDMDMNYTDRAPSPHPPSLSPPKSPHSYRPQYNLHELPSPEGSDSEGFEFEQKQAPMPPRHRVAPPQAQITPPSSRPNCVLCEEELRQGEAVVRTDYGHIHNFCFVCHECNEPLEHSEFYFRDGRALCHLDYHHAYSERCGYCGTPVEHDGIVALDKHWHRGHFFCHDCSQPFGDTDDYFVDGKDVLCGACFGVKHAIKCWRCKAVCEHALEALGRTWCTQCFCCEICTIPFDTEEFVLREDGTLVCHDCETLRIKQECWR